MIGRNTSIPGPGRSRGAWGWAASDLGEPAIRASALERGASKQAVSAPSQN